MGPIKAGIQMVGGYYMLKTAAGAMEKHDQNKHNNQQNNHQQYQQPYQQPGQFNPQHQNPQQQASRGAPEGGQTYGKYVTPDGTEYPVYQPQPQFQGAYQPVPPQFQNQTSRNLEYVPPHQQHEQRSIAHGSPSPTQQGHQEYHQHPMSSTPPPYQGDRKS